MSNIYAKVILDSIGPNGRRLITVEARYWRAIHSEIMTHRDRARNAASSRAIPFYKEVPVYAGGQLAGMKVADNCTFNYIDKDAFFPEFIGTEQKGMQSGDELKEPNRTKALEIINQLRLSSLRACMNLHELGVHKSIINRYLEPWSYITILMTATEWKNFYRLRIHPKAEKHFNQIAKMIKEAIDKSTPQYLESGQWHLPYVEDLDWIAVENESLDQQIETMKKVSAGRCARLSYLTHDGKRSIEADLGIFEKLIHPKIEEDRDDDVIHSSPLEHVAQTMVDPKYRSGPLVGWRQFRKQFPNENVEG